MNLPEVVSYEDQAIDTIVHILNKAKTQLGIRQNLIQLARSREDIAPPVKVSLKRISYPLGRSLKKFILRLIEWHWELVPTFKYIIRYMGSSQDETSQFYYYEAIFSQPTASHPIPQATATVFFKILEKHVDPPEIEGVPMMSFRLEGQFTDYDVQYVALTADWLLALLQMKLKFFKKIEKVNYF